MSGSLFEIAGTGGPVLALLGVLSILSIGLICAKIVGLISVRSGAAGRADALAQWSQGNRDAAIAKLAAGKAPADRVAHYALTAASKQMARKPLEAELTRQGNAEVQDMSRNLRLLELIAMVAPLLGLLGTVLGMIQSFQELEMAQGAANASVLAGGIWQALLTTAAGLIVAIPAAVGAGLLSARVDAAAHDIESAIGQFFLIEDTNATPASG